LNPEYEKEDAIHIRDLVIKRMEEAFPLISQDVPVKKHKVRYKPNTFPKFSISLFYRRKTTKEGRKRKKRAEKSFDVQLCLFYPNSYMFQF